MENKKTMTYLLYIAAAGFVWRLPLRRPPPGGLAAGRLLYRQADGSFRAKDAYAAYTLQLSGTESEARQRSRWTERRGITASRRRTAQR